MSAKGCCYDNASAESFFHSLKVECIHGERFASREIMRTTVFNYIECDYNRWRRHSACGGINPEQFENQTLAYSCVHIMRVGAFPPLTGFTQVGTYPKALSMGLSVNADNPVLFITNRF